MKLRPIYLLILLLLARMSYCSEAPLVGRENTITLADRFGNQTFDYYITQVSDDPYNPGSFAWGYQYHARGCLIMYNLTGDIKWLDWALNMTDHFVTYSDVNGDGEPAWGNYNETWGNSRYDFREYTVWDGVIGLPVIEAAKIIRNDGNLSSDPNFSARADAYVDLITQVIQRHHKSWTQVSDDQGYYWDDPNEDVGPIVNRFTALGRVELVLGDVTGNISYYDKPRQMAKYFVDNMCHSKVEDLYTWSYKIGDEGAEDISHGAIELEFLIMANERGLLEDCHILRLCNTYLKRIWQVPELFKGKHILAMKVDGTDIPEYDYARISRNWILLSPYNSTIYDHQRTVFGILHEKSGIYPYGVSLLGLAQIPLSAENLRSVGENPDRIVAVDLELLDLMLDDAYDRLNQTMALGSCAEIPRSNLEEASEFVNEASLCNSSVPIALIWKAWDVLGRMMDTGKLLQHLSSEMAEAEELGADLSDLKPNLSRLQADFTVAEYTTELEIIDMEIENLTIPVQKAIAETLINQADEVIREAKNMGIDTSRHEIFLRRAYEEFEKGNYGPARQFTNYPLGLREDIVEFGMSQVGALLVVSILLIQRKKGIPFLL